MADEIGPKRVIQYDSEDEAHQILERQGGIFMLQAEIDDCVSHSISMDALIGKLRGDFKDRPMTVILNSPGGNVEHGLAIYDTLRMLVASGTEVHIVGLGHVASMGTVIMQAGSRRISMPNTQYLVHQLSMTIDYYRSEEVKQIEERAEEAKRLNDIVMGIIAKRSGIGLAELKALCTKKDHWMDAAAARKLGANGLIDEVCELPPSLAKAFSASIGLAAVQDAHA
jgi:ATP-dependent Clp protease protease subunit